MQTKSNPRGSAALSSRKASFKSLRVRFLTTALPCFLPMLTPKRFLPRPLAAA
jgi:hypothetical protein